MQTEFIVVRCDVHCEWTGPHPRYRCYVDDELFSERTWIWHDVYLEENFQIQAPVGKYTVRVELLDTAHANIQVRNLQVNRGPAVITPDGRVQIYTPEHSNENA